MEMPVVRWAEIVNLEANQADGHLRAIESSDRSDQVLMDIVHVHKWKNLPAKAAFTDDEVRTCLENENFVKKGEFLMVWNPVQRYIIVYKDTRGGPSEFLSDLLEDEEYDPKDYMMSLPHKYVIRIIWNGRPMYWGWPHWVDDPVDAVGFATKKEADDAIGHWHNNDVGAIPVATFKKPRFGTSKGGQRISVSEAHEDEEEDPKEFCMRQPPIASVKSWFDGDTMQWQLFYDGKSQGWCWSTNEAIARAARDGAVWAGDPPELSHLEIGYDEE